MYNTVAMRRGCVSVAIFTASLLVTPSAQPQITYLTHAQAKPVFQALGEPLPSAAQWPEWIAAADRSTRARVAQGVEASIVNLLLFGTSFTSEPRVTTRQLKPAEINRAVGARLGDFERALAKPEANERLLLARQALQGAGTVRAQLLSMIDRSMKENETYARLIEQAQRLGNPSLEFAERSTMYRERGLAPDTSLRVNFAIEEALRGLTPVLVRGSDPMQRSVRRVAIIGPGLDFADKQEGFDFYPLQTIQPFAIIDSLTRLDLADPDTLQVATLDLNDQITGHITQAVHRARGGTPYLLYLPLDGGVAWSPALDGYFRRFGSTIGAAVPVTIPAGIGPVKLRAVSVRPAIVERISARDLNVTAQLPSFADAERFDLIVGTNIFLYYDRLQQGLAMAAIASMLRPGGVLLSNNALVEVPDVGMRSIGYSKTLYSNRDEDGDVVIWYQKAG
jgi:hypothetical protein